MLLWGEKALDENVSAYLSENVFPSPPFKDNLNGTYAK